MRVGDVPASSDCVLNLRVSAGILLISHLVKHARAQENMDGLMDDRNIGLSDVVTQRVSYARRVAVPKPTKCFGEIGCLCCRFWNEQTKLGIQIWVSWLSVSLLVMFRIIFICSRKTLMASVCCLCCCKKSLILSSNISILREVL